MFRRRARDPGEQERGGALLEHEHHGATVGGLSQLAALARRSVQRPRGDGACASAQTQRIFGDERDPRCRSNGGRRAPDHEVAQTGSHVPR